MSTKNPNAVLAEALARVEYKLDLLMNGLGLAGGSFLPMHFTGRMCPACKQMVDYQIDVVNEVVMHKCGCKTGKQPPIIPLVPVTPGEAHADAGRDGGSAGNEGAAAPEDRRRGEGR